MTLYGLDVSSYNPNLPIATLKSQGYSFLSARCVIGNVKDTQYPIFRDAAKKADLLFAAYVFIHTAISPSTLATLTRAYIGDPTIPIMIDWENDGTSVPSIADALHTYDALKAAGLNPVSLYTYKGYWSARGEPNLTVRPWKLIGADFALNPSGYASAIYPGDNSPRWQGYGGLPKSILQFGSKIKISGYSGYLDGDAYKGSLAQLTVSGLFHDWTPPIPPAPAPKGNAAMILIAPDKSQVPAGTPWPGIHVWDGSSKPVHVTSHNDHVAFNTAGVLDAKPLSWEQWELIVNTFGVIN